MIESIAATAMSMSAAKFSTDYALAVTKMSMDNQEEAAQTLINQMMPASPVAPPGVGDFIDTYA